MKNISHDSPLGVVDKIQKYLFLLICFNHLTKIREQSWKNKENKVAD
jgi:hypothetical protein